MEQREVLDRKFENFVTIINGEDRKCQVQKGSEIRTYPDFEWSKRDLFSNVPNGRPDLS